MIIGLTGNIGCGKSTVARHLAYLGAEVLDADLVAMEAVRPGTPALERIKKEFGTGVIKENGHLDRYKLASVVFDDPAALAKLESIIHPEVVKVVSEKIAEYREGHGTSKHLVVEVPLLIEIGMHGMMDEVWVVIADPDKQISRVMKRSKLNKKEVLKRINAQMSQTEKCRYANRIIDNSGTMENTIQQVENIWKHYA
jgi:dephospho-CoA kinase